MKKLGKKFWIIAGIIVVIVVVAALVLPQVMGAQANNQAEGLQTAVD